MTGILLSLNGGVIKPMRKLGFWSGTGGAAVEGVKGVAEGSKEESRRVARFLTLDSNGRSDED